MKRKKATELNAQHLAADQHNISTAHIPGLTSNALKTIAIVAMLIDHLAVTFVPYGTLPWIVMRFVGRFTAPIMFYQSVEGYHHTRSANRYTLRLATFAAISYIPYLYFAFGALPNADNFYNLNVIFTILLGLLAVRARNELKNPVLSIGTILALLMLSIIGDLAYMCVIMMLAMDYFYGDFRRQTFAYLLIIMGLNGLLPLFLQPLIGLVYEKTFDFAAYWPTIIGFGLLVPIYLLSRYNREKGSKGNLSKWGFYIFYPLHLLILGLVKNLLL